MSKKQETKKKKPVAFMLKLSTTEAEKRKLLKLLSYFRAKYGLPAGQAIYLSVLNRSRTATQ